MGRGKERGWGGRALPGAPAGGGSGCVSGLSLERTFHFTYKDRPSTISSNHENGREAETSEGQRLDLQAK